ncbi:DYW domain containing protein [Parasponia andersonii]|uniref:DYW domain containing protein n=1 Tax=Parasponia andersonii TaxID=3476 RepID=A0A2P5DXL1_PARAD|nr:DYW domain containing protein [Parasponia andersonii]
MLLKLRKHSFFINASREKLRFCLASTSSATTATVAEAIAPQLNPQNTQLRESQEPPFSCYLDPKYVISLLLRSRDIFHTRQIHSQVTIHGMLQNLNVANKLLYTYAQHKALGDAYAFFGEMGERDSVSWSVMIGGFAKVGDYTRCFGIFREVIQYGVRPDNYTLPFLIRCCRDMVNVLNGRVIHDVVLKHGLESNRFVCAALVDMYAKCRVIEDARKLFDEMPSRDLVSWTVMIGGYAECGNAYESLVLFDSMREEGVVPDKISMVTVVSACAKLGAMNKARLVHDYVFGNKFSLDVILGTAMIDMHAKCGCIDSARDIFDKMKDKNVVSWSAMIAAYGYHGHGRKALDTFSMMLSSGTLPNAITFVSLLYACSHAGLIEEGLRFFTLMWDEYSVTPNVKHYTCMVDLLGRAGRLDQAVKLVESMKVEKDEGLWGALLGACRIHGHIDLAEKAANSLLQLQPHNAGHYVLLSNIYAKAGRWKDVAKIRDLMTRSRLKKVPGWTWIEAYNNFHKFSSGDETHPMSKEIYEMLRNLNEKLKLAGYVPDTSFVLQGVDEEVKLGMLYAHSERLAIAFGLIATPAGAPIRITKNLRVCGDCHTFSKFVSAITQRVIIVRDSNRFHHFK